MARETSKGFLLRLDAETMKQVEAWAAREFRSTNGQLQWIIHDSLVRHGIIKTKPDCAGSGNSAAGTENAD